MRTLRRLLLAAYLAAASVNGDAATLWLTDNAQLFAIDTATNEAHVVTPTRDIADLAPVHEDRAWILLGRSLQKYSAAGALEIVIDLAALNVKDPSRIAGNSADGSVWLASRSRLYHFASDGSLVHSLAASAPPLAISVASDQTLWVLTSRSLSHFSAEGRSLETVRTDAFPFDAADHLMVAAAGGHAWVATRGRLARIDLRRRRPAVENVSLNDAAADFAWDGVRRQVWVAAGASVVGFDGGALPVREVSLAHLGFTKITALAVDPRDGTFWVGHDKGLSHVDATGSLLSQPQIVAATTQARFAPEAPGLRLQLLDPAANVTTSSATPLFSLRVEKLCSGVPCPAELSADSNFLLRARLDSLDVGSRFRFDAEGNAVFTPTEALSPGAHHFTAVATSQDGVFSNEVDITFVVALGNTSNAGATSTSGSTTSGGTSHSSTPSLSAQAGPGGNSPPTVSMTAPTNGANFASGSDINLSASAADSNGTVTKVEFYRGGTTLIGAATSSPYTFTWNNVATGSYSLTAKATDNAGAVTTSAAVNITVAGAAPTVSITSPANGATFSAPASIAITANAADSDGSVANVEFFQGTISLGTVNAAPYTLNWSNVAPGSYSLTARATDNSGLSAMSAAVSVTVDTPNAAPLVVMTLPVTCSTAVAGSALTLAADALDTDGSVASVSFYQGSTLIGTAMSAPYSIAWSNPSAGTWSLTAAVTDNRGITTVSQPISVSVVPPNVPPTVSMTSPSSGASFGIGSNVLLAATAGDADGTVTKVEFYVGSTRVGTATASPYTANWVPSASGSYALTARATDSSGATTTSEPVSVSVLANALPTVSMTSPTNGASYRAGTSVTLSATASDSDGAVARVDFYANQTFVGSAPASPYSVAWSAGPAGSYTLTAVAMDNLGGTKTSAPVSISITPNSAPSVSLTSPAAGATFYAGASVQLAASAMDSDGVITKIEFFRGATLIGSTTAEPYQFSWDNVPVGNYSITAKASDNDGATTSSSPVSISVLSNIPPGVIIASPANNSSFYAPATIALTANALDNDGTVARVDFFQGTTLIGSATAAPFAVTWSKVPVGAYSLTATAVDNVGAATTSEPIAVNVLGPSLTITEPAANAVLSGDTVIVRGTYGGPANSGVSVNGVVAAVDRNNQYFAQVPLASGANTLTATITTPDGTTGTNRVTVTSDGVPAAMPVDISTTDLEGIAPFVVTFSVSNPTVASVVVQLNGEPPITVAANGTAEMQFSFPGAGVFPMTITATDSQNVTTSRTYLVSASDTVQMDQIAAAVWNGMNEALIAGDKNAAMTSLNKAAQAKYGPVFDALMPTYSSIVTSFSPLQRGTLAADYAEYAINRTIDGIDRLFLIYFVKGADGVWQLDSM